jgi:hypothetical protein
MRLLVAPAGRPGPLFESAEGPLHVVAELVSLGIEPRRPSARGSLRLTAGELVATLGDGVLDPLASQVGSRAGVGVRLVGQKAKAQVMAATGR